MVVEGTEIFCFDPASSNRSCKNEYLLKIEMKILNYHKFSIQEYVKVINIVLKHFQIFHEKNN